jgi:hypothetical protein
MRTAYYQTFTGLKTLLAKDAPCDFTTLVVGAVHFGRDADTGKAYIHLNDHPPNDPRFDSVWSDLRQLKQKMQKTVPSFRVLVMIGGAAGQDFHNLFHDFGTFYPLLQQFLSQHWFISGVDIDVEETTSTDNIAMLIRTLRQDFGVQAAAPDPRVTAGSRFCITMAPVSEALSDTDPYGLDYKTLDPLVDWYHVQCYGEFQPATLRDGNAGLPRQPRVLTPDVVQQIVDNGFSAAKLVLGMLGKPDPDPAFVTDVVPVLRSINSKHAVLGFFVWEYFIAPPQPADPQQWAHLIKTQVQADAQERRTWPGCTMM